MKKLLLIASLMMILPSCVDKSNVKNKNTEYRLGKFGYILKIVEIEGCEYFYTTYNRGAMCHKGNCKNPIHYKNK